ncbi:MAG TPA: hypothetical protein VJ783_25065 [Pirellulales bacterium]|nr:hypothetical protein [Pirellulales bacterium]
MIDGVGLLKEQPASPDAPKNGGQESAIPTTLDKALARALHANPDILLAIARLDEARAKRDQIRLKVVEQVTATVHAYQNVMHGSQPVQVEGRTLNQDNAGAELGYLLGAGGDEPLEEMKKNEHNDKTNAEALASRFARNLGKSLERALQSNPDLRLADAKVRGAEAELNQIRLATARKVAIAFHRRQNDKEALVWSKANFDAGINPQMEHVLTARQSAAESEAELLYLLGAGTDAAADTAPAEQPAGDEPKAEPAIGRRPELPKKLQEALAKTVTVDFKPVVGETGGTRPTMLADALKVLNSASDVRIVVSNSAGPIAANNMVSVRDVTVLSILEMLADQTECAFIVRDYGLLAVPRGEAWQYPGAAIPRDLPLRPQL